MYVKTKRLELKSMAEADREALTELFTEPLVCQTYMVPEFAHRGEAEPLAERVILLSQNPGRNVAGIYRNGQLIGMLNQTDAFDDTVEVGYALLPRYWGQGYATEALTAAISAFFAQGFQEVLAGAFEENVASTRVMIKSGMTLIDRRDVVSYRGKDHLCVYCSVKNPAFGGAT